MEDSPGCTAVKRRWFGTAIHSEGERLRSQPGGKPAFAFANATEA